MQANGSIYGARDAGRAWYRHLRATLASKDVRESSLERGLYVLVDGDGSCMVIHSHVDDLAIAFKSKPARAVNVLEYIVKKLHMARNTNNVYCGKTLEILAERIVVRQPAAAASIEHIELARYRKSKPDSPLGDEEKSEYRSVLGQVQWVTGQTRPDAVFAASRAAQFT